MANQGVGNTALGAAVCRLIEQFEPEETRLFQDPVVKDLVNPPIRVLMQFAGMRQFTKKQTDAALPGIYGAQICRARFIDDVAADALSNGIQQLVILGAGMDTRAYRLPGIERARVFEVDLAGAQDEKKGRLQRRFGQLPGNVTFLPIDFETQTLESVCSAALDLAQPAVFVWEGVTQYLSEASVRQTLSFVGQTAPGSVLVFTYVLKSVIERRSDIPGADKMMDRLAKNRAPWVYGLEPGRVAAFLQPFHLELVADVGSGDYQEKYLRPLKRDLVVSAVERIVLARVSRA